MMKKLFDWLYLKKLDLIKIKNYFFILYKLKKIGFTNIEAFHYKYWRNGYCYFTAYKKKQKVFIKVDTKLHLLSNENTLYNLMEHILSEYMIRKIAYIEEKKTQFLILEYQDSKELKEKDLIMYPQYLNDIFYILKTFNKKQIIHRDIKLDNFLIIDGKLKIIDFTFTNSWNKKLNFIELDIHSKYHYSLLQGLGNKLNPKDFVWNDFYSMGKILENILSNNYLEKDVKKYIEEYKNKFFLFSKETNYYLIKKDKKYEL